MLQSTANKALLEALKVTGHHPPAGTTVDVEIPCAEEWISQGGLSYHKIAEIWHVEFGAMDGNKQLYYLSQYPCYDAIKKL